MKKRNSLIELYRFLFALNVVKNHGFFPYQGSYFSPGRISVEFFFVLSGFLLLGSMDKYMSLPLKQGLPKFIIAKLKSLAIPLIVAIPCNIAYSILSDGGSINIWGCLWYVEAMLVVFIGYYLIRYFVKNKKTFNMILISIFLIAAILHIIPFFYSWGYIRAAMGISLGMLISYLPKIKLNHQKLLWIALIPIQLAVLAIFLFGNNLLIEEILDLVLYPALIYLSFQLPVQNKVFNYLGALSFGLYAFQAVTRMLRELGVTNLWTLFIIIVILSIAEDLFKRLYRKQKLKNIIGLRKVVK